MKNHQDKIAIYSRKSRFTGKGESIGNQIDLCREYVRGVFGQEALGGCVVFEDEGFSGGNLKRPDFQRMMEAVRSGEFKAIVVYRLDRISRNISDFTGLIDELTKLGVSFVSIREQFDTSTPMGRAMMFIISVFSQLERETIAERIRDNMHELAKTGRWLGGNTPTGYESESVSTVSVDGKSCRSCRLKLLPEEGEVVKTIFELYIETDSLTATEAKLLSRGLKTKKGNDFSRFSVKAILQNPVYAMADRAVYRYLLDKGVDMCSCAEEFDGNCGLMVYNRTEQEKGKAAVFLPMCQWIVAVGKHPGLIPGDQWVRTQQSLERNKSGAYRKPRSNEALLTGLLYCSCGSRMYPKLSGRRTERGDLGYTYVCKMKERSKGQRCNQRNINGNALDFGVLERIKQLPEDAEAFRRSLRKKRRLLLDTVDLGSARLAALKAELAQQEKKVEGLIDSMSMLEESTAKLPVIRRIEQLSESKRNLERLIEDLNGCGEARELSDERLGTYGQKLGEFQWNVDEMSVEEKREAIRLLIRKAEWDGDDVQVILREADEDGEKYFNE